MLSHRLGRGGARCAVVLLSITSFAHAGPLSPPAGPVAPTAGPEPRVPLSASNTPGDANSVFRITTPGSYYLTGNIAVPNGYNGIEIDTDNVSLDLMGFAISGEASSKNGIEVTGIRSHTTVTNGFIRDMGESGVLAFNDANIVTSDLQVSRSGLVGITLGIEGRIEGCVADANGTEGLFVGARGMIRDSLASSNGNRGIFVGASGRLLNSVATANLAAGIELALGAVVESCTAIENGGNGFEGQDGLSLRGCTATLNTGGGFHLTDACSIDDCTAWDNGGNGFFVGSSCAFRDSTSKLNGEWGFRVYSGSTLESCTADNNGFESFLLTDGYGFYCAGTNVVLRACTARNNAGPGIRCSSDSLVDRCVSKGNMDGIYGGHSSRVERCLVRDNAGNGIAMGEFCVIEGNQTTGNGGHGITVLGNSYVVGNHSTGNSRGIYLQDSGSVATGNYCTGNTISDISATGSCAIGPIVSSTTTPIPTTSAWANFN